MKRLQTLLFSLTVACASAACANTAHYQVSDGGGAPRLESVFAQVHTSVVTIRTVGKSTQTDSLGRLVSAAGVGSGVLISTDGRILTASHVIQTADKVQVEFPDGTTIQAKVLSSMPSADVAVIQLMKPAPKMATVAPLGDSDKVRVGSQTFVVGAPLGISHTLTVGHISARRAVPLSPGSERAIELFQTDAAINPGNSGGPMFNMQGEVIGIVSHIITETGGSAGLGFAVTSNVARELMLERNAFWSGMDEVMLTGLLAEAMNIPDGRSGMLVQRVAKGSGAERLGLRGGSIPIEIAGQQILIGGDVILEVLGHSLSEAGAETKVMNSLGQLQKGDEISVKIVRAGKLIELKKTLGDLQR